MRVIAGKARSIPLKTPKGADTRPTSDRTKETLFNMIQPHIMDCNFLDLFSGSGGIGIEALSRGAGDCVFVENNKEALSCIKENLQKTKLIENSQVIAKDVLFALRQLEGQMIFDCVFMDPPYNHELEKEILFYFESSKLLASNCLVVVEASNDTDFSYLEETGFSLYKEKVYKTNKHLFLKRREDIK